MDDRGRSASQLAPEVGSSYRDALEDLASVPPHTDARSLVPGAPVPFEPILRPFVSYARDRVRARIADPSLLQDEAWRDLEARLLAQLAGLLLPALWLELRASLVLHGVDLGVAPAEASDEPRPSAVYDELVGELGSPPGRRRFLEEYAVLARLLCTTVLDWIARIAELIDRIRTDRAEVGLAFGAGVGTGRVARVLDGLSDPHDGGRTVAIVGFETGLSVVYKPRSVAIDGAFADLVDWLAGRDPALALRAPRVLDRGSYGWAEHIPHTGAGAAARYYERAGMLLCLVHALEGTDFHVQNLIASDGYPVPIDLEGLFHARFPRLVTETLDPEVATSVLRTGFLPRGGERVDKSGLDPDPGGEALVPVCIHINTDDMRISHQLQKTELPDGQPMAVRAHLGALVEGFTRMYRGLMAARAPLLAADGPLARFQGLRARFIFRPSLVYGTMIRNLLRAKLLREGVDRSIEIEALCRPFVGPAGDQLPWAIFAAEARAIERNDLPIFETSTDGHELRAEGSVIVDGCFERSAFTCVRERIAALAEDDLARQVRFIRGSLAKG